MKKLVLFDLDGVLLDSKDNMRRAWAVVQERSHVKNSFEDYFSKIGRPFQDILAMLGVTHETKRIEQIYMEASFDFLSAALFFPDAEKTLQILSESGIRLGVVTSKDAQRTRAILRQIDVNFDTIQCPKRPFRGKPAPDLLLIAMAEARTDPTDTVYVGDMETDWEAAKRAQVDYIHAAWGYGYRGPGTNTIESIQQLIDKVL